MKYKSGVQVTLMGLTISAPVMAWVGEGGERCSTQFRVKVDTVSSAIPYALQVWGDKRNNEAGEAIMAMVKERGRRVVAVGLPADNTYKEKIQHQVTLQELWVEDEAGENFIAVILPKKVEDEIEREYKPIDMPELASSKLM